MGDKCELPHEHLDMVICWGPLEFRWEERREQIRFALTATQVPASDSARTRRPITDWDPHTIIRALHESPPDESWRGALKLPDLEDLLRRAFLAQHRTFCGLKLDVALRETFEERDLELLVHEHHDGAEHG